MQWPANLYLNENVARKAARRWHHVQPKAGERWRKHLQRQRWQRLAGQRRNNGVINNENVNINVAEKQYQ
jgi:hypothetical protein